MTETPEFQERRPSSTACDEECTYAPPADSSCRSSNIRNSSSTSHLLPTTAFGVDPI